jgi:hypothetical protein
MMRQGTYQIQNLKIKSYVVEPQNLKISHGTGIVTQQVPPPPHIA